MTFLDARRGEPYPQVSQILCWYAILHYHNPEHLQFTDTSGLRISYSTRPRRYAQDFFYSINVEASVGTLLGARRGSRRHLGFAPRRAPRKPIGRGGLEGDAAPAGPAALVPDQDVRGHGRGQGTKYFGTRLDLCRPKPLRNFQRRCVDAPRAKYPQVAGRTDPAQRLISTQVYFHAHAVGSEMYAMLWRDGAAIEMASEEHWSYFHPSDLPLKPGAASEIRDGDVLQTTCVFNTTARKNATRFGPARTDEMRRAA